MAGISYFTGIAVNGNYLYQSHYDSLYSFCGISRTDLTTKVRTDRWKDYATDLNYITSITSNSTYIIMVGNYQGLSECIYIVDFDGTYVKHFNTGNTPAIVKADDTYIYTYEYGGEGGYYIRKYSVSSETQEWEISLDNAPDAFSVYDSEIYVVIGGKIKKYNSSGVFQEEFDITGTITDAVII